MFEGRIFQEFQRFAPGSGAEHGLGLGLSIVDRISRILAHPVRFASRPGEGTTITACVPRGKGAQTPSPVEAMPPRTPLNLERAVVLCIDDDTTALDGMRALLESWSCQVLVARGLGEAAALALAPQPKPELLIVDYHLDRGADGVDCVVALRRAYGVVIPAVIVSADHAPAARAHALSRGLALLHKPVKPAALRSLLMRLLAARQAAE